MNKLCHLLNFQNESELFDKITKSFKSKITQWNYFVNWEKVLRNIAPIETELNILNTLIGKVDLKSEISSIIKKYPNVIKAFPILLAIRDNSIDVLIDTKNFIYRNFNFKQRKLSEQEIDDLSVYLLNSGFGKIIKDRKLKNLVDYATGVEVGLDSNGRKNRGGKLMENLVEEFVKDAIKNTKFEYMPQATAKKIKEKWNIDVEVDKSSRIIDFAINKNGKLFFIECNFYGGGGSKLKSTATEYIEMNRYWNKQNIEFIWITDGAGWQSTLKSLREYFDKADYLLNLEMLKDGVLKQIINV